MSKVWWSLRACVVFMRPLVTGVWLLFLDDKCLNVFYLDVFVWVRGRKRERFPCKTFLFGVLWTNPPAIIVVCYGDACVCASIYIWKCVCVCLCTYWRVRVWAYGRVVGNTATRVAIEEHARNQLSKASTARQKTNYDNFSQCVGWLAGWLVDWPGR